MKHSRSGSGKLALRGLLGMGRFPGDGCAHRVIRAGYGGFGKRRRKHSKSSLGLGFLDALPGTSTIKSFLPPISKENAIRWGTGLSGALLPITVQNMVIPATWRIGWKGLLTYTALGGTYLMIAGKVKMLADKKSDIAFGWGFGFLLKTFQDYIFKRSLIPVQNVIAPTSLKDCGACATCANAGSCVSSDGEDIGCLGYISEDEVGDYDDMGWIDGINDLGVKKTDSGYGWSEQDPSKRRQKTKAWQGYESRYLSDDDIDGFGDDDIDGFGDDDIDGFGDDDIDNLSGRRAIASRAVGDRSKYAGHARPSEAQARQRVMQFLSQLSPQAQEAAKADLRTRYARGEKLSQYTKQQIENWAKRYKNYDVNQDNDSTDGFGDYMTLENEF
jgi:hypothetical protein